MQLHIPSPFVPCAQIPLIVADIGGIPLKTVISEDLKEIHLSDPSSPQHPVSTLTTSYAISTYLCKVGNARGRGLLGQGDGTQAPTAQDLFEEAKIDSYITWFQQTYEKTVLDLEKVI